MTLPPTPEGLPPLPKGLKGALALQSEWRNTDEVHALKTAIQEDLRSGEGENQEKKSMQGSLTQLRQDMVSLRQLDLSLFCQLLRLYENIQDWKQMLSEQDVYDYSYNTGTFASLNRRSHEVIKEKVHLSEQWQMNAQSPKTQTTQEEPIYENTPATRPSFWHTRRKGRSAENTLSSSPTRSHTRSHSGSYSGSPARSNSRSPALDNPDFDESMLGPTSTSRRLSKQHQVDASVIPRYIARTPTGSNSLGASETLAWLASGSPYKSNGSASSHTSSSASLDKSLHNSSASTASIAKSHCAAKCNHPSQNRTSTPVFNESSCWSPIKRQGSVSTASNESLYLEPLPCVHAEHHRTMWNQTSSSSPTYQNCSGMSGYERQLSANSSYLYESTC